MSPVPCRGITASELRSIRHRLSEYIDAAALDPGLWPEFIDAVHSLLPGLKVAFMVRDAHLAKPLPLYAAGWNERDMASFHQHYSALNPWNHVWSGRRILSTYLSDELYPTAQLEKTAFYNEWLRPVGGAKHASAIKLYDEAGRIATLGVHHGGSRFESTHGMLKPVLDALAPRLRGALHANRISSFRRAPLPGNLMDTLVDPAFLLDENCKVLGTNAAADALVADGHLVWIRAGDRLELASAGGQRLLVKAVWATCQKAAAAPATDFQLAAGDEDLTVSILPISQNLLSLAVSGAPALFLPHTLALVVVRKRVKPAAALDTLGRLTPAEKRLVRALHESGSLVDIAQRQGIAYETARSQLKSIYAKTGVNRQRELLALFQGKL